MNRIQYIFKGITLIVFIGILGLNSSCKKETEPENAGPSVEITSPQDEEIFQLGDTVFISANASDPDGTIRDIQFYINGIKDSVFTSPPYSYEWYTIDENNGAFDITAIAVDDNGEDDIARATIFLKDLGTVTDYDGNVYQWTRIGEQRWMLENLKTTHYSDGTEIPLVESVYGWENLDDTDKGYSFYDNSSSNSDVYGALYNWAAVMNDENSSDTIPSGVQGVCPTGWHLPSDAEWKELEMFLLMSEDHVNDIGWRGLNQGGKLKEEGTEHWESPNSGATNEADFTALPGGYRIYYGTFNELGFGAHYWSATEYNSSQSWKRYIHADKKTVGRKMELKKSGFSVRCIED